MVPIFPEQTHVGKNDRIEGATAKEAFVETSLMEGITGRHLSTEAFIYCVQSSEGLQEIVVLNTHRSHRMSPFDPFS